MTLSLSLSLALSSSRPTPQPEGRRLYRVLHDKELYGRARDEVLRRGVPLPQVHQLLPVHFIPLTRSLQMLIAGINATMSGRDVRRLLSCHRFATNNNGFDCAEPAQHGPFVDYINGMDLGAPLPKMESLLCGGATIAGVETVYKGERVLQVETIDANAAIPTAEYVLARPWLWYEAISVRPDGGVQSFGITAGREFMPIVSKQAVYIGMEKVRAL